MIIEEIKEYDSREELEMGLWLAEAERHGLVCDIKYHFYSFVLSEKVTVSKLVALKTKNKTVEHTLLNQHKYTPDFSFRITSKLIGKLFKSWYHDLHLFVYIDVKGSFNRFSGDREFSINQKWMWKSKGIYIQKVVPSELFLKTWVPEECRLSPKKRQPVKKYIGTPTIEEWIREQSK
ncbi:hypothetical protein C4588_06220 [Candidatus Parcubacteria bacterium]|nr:MAG: hypothetical protein C4588_06220 [Candidatus Parcubacteria bacterium]